MKWRGREESTNVEDRRGIRPATAGAVGGLGMVIIVVLGLLFGMKPEQIKQIVDAQKNGAVRSGRRRAFESTPEEEERVSFIKVVLRDTEKVWARVRRNGEDVSRTETGDLPRCR